MAISIKQPAALCEKGMREVNEDYIYPQFGQIDETQRFFMVCDGMGGEGKGDVAAKMVANHMANFLSSLSWGSSPSDEQLKQGLVSAEEALHYLSPTIFIGNSSYHIWQGKSCGA